MAEERGEQSPPERDLVARHLGRAWSSFTPDVSLQERVRARLTSSAAATLGAVGAGAALKTPADSSWTSLASGKLGTTLVGAGLLGLGLLSGYLIRDARQDEALPPALPAPMASAIPEGTLELLPELRAEPAPALVERVAAPVRRRVKTAVTQPEAAPGVPALPEPNDELALLRRAERAVRAEDSALALALIAELEQRYPRSTLLEERRAIELLAYCGAGSTDAPARAQRFLREHPHSVHAGRIAEECAGAGQLSSAER